MDENPTQKQRKRKNKTHEITSSSSQNSVPIPYLQEEIISEILSRLPVKSLLQFRSVSKLWRSLISSPQFIKTHLTKSIGDTKFTHHRLILSYPHPRSKFKSCSVYSVFNEPSTDAVELDYPMKTPHTSVLVVGSCNGLVCLGVGEDSIFLWNPSTRKSRRLPDINMAFECYSLYGFGYDDCSHDFKVVGMSRVHRDDGAYETRVKVYSSKADCWRRIENFSFGFRPDDLGKFANGALHWDDSRDIRSNFPNSGIIVSLDLAKETYGEVLQPSYGEGECYPILEVLGESLCILCNYVRTRMDMWIMKEYGVRESWTKLVTIPYLNEPMMDWYSNPLWISENGDILLEFESDLILYNANDNTFKDPELPNFDGFLAVDTYIESLVSPNF